MLIQEAKKLYNKLAKELVDESITNYASSISSLSLSVLPLSDEKEQQQSSPLLRMLPEAEESRQAHIHRKQEDKFISSRLGVR